jgi:exosome complex component RRP45
VYVSPYCSNCGSGVIAFVTHKVIHFPRILAQVSCEVQQPKPTRPNEGLLFINVELSPMGAPHFEAGRQSELAVQLNRLLEKCIKDSRCLDLEALCIVAEEKVYLLI